MKLTLLLPTFLLFFISIQLCSQTFTLRRFPAPLQLYPRDKLDSASVEVDGSISTAGFDSAIVEVKRNGAAYRRLSVPLLYGGGSASFSFAPSIHAELAEYSILLSVKNSSVTQLLASRDSIVCGDVFLINGQSNSWPANGLATYVNEYCRGFGRSTGYNPYDPADTAWGLSRATGYSNYLAHAGVWGLRLAQLIKETYHVPVCFINGGSGGSSIEYNLPNDANLMDLNTTYGRLLYRTTKAGVTGRVRAILWHQGESNTDATWTNYAANFQKLSNAWHRDYPGLENVCLFQIHQGCGGGFQENLRDLQRRFPDFYADMEIMSTAGIPGHDGCHYNFDGYNQMAGQVFRQIARLLYGSPDTVDINPPAIAKAFYTSASAREIALVFSRTNTLRWPADTLGQSMKDYFYLDGAFGSVVSGRASHDTLFLQLNAPSAALSITYLPNIYQNNSTSIYEGPWIRNGRGVGALSFAGVPILSPPDAPPAQILPARNTANQPVPAQFRWSSVRHAQWYRLQVAGDSLFGQIVADRPGLSDTTLSASNLSSDTRYFWRVRAGNEVMESGWSPIWKFTTVVQTPGMPILLTPVNGAFDQPVSVNFSWIPADRAAEYQIQAARDSLFHVPVFDQVVPATSAQFTGTFPRQKYFWRVRARNAGGYSSWTESWSFTTAPDPPPACILQSPANHAAEVDRAPLLTWHPAPGAAVYRLQLGRDSLFNAPLVDDSTLADTFRVPPPLDYSLVYFWRVRALNPGGNSPWSGIWDFETIMQSPGVVEPLDPPDGSTKQPAALQLRWRTAATASRYRLQIARDSLFTAPLVDITTADTLAGTGPLENDATYRWRVRGWNPGGEGDWSRVCRFTTITLPPGDVTLRLPAQGAGDVPLPAVLRWDPADRAASYLIQMAADTNFTALAFSDSTTQNGMRISSGLRHDTRYCWRVRARNEGGSGNWSLPSSFRTVAVVPPAPLLIQPPDGAPDQPLTITLRWSPADGAENYHLQVAADSNFMSIALEDTAILLPARIAGPFPENSRFFWRVRATNRLGASPWSEIWDFTSQPAVPEIPLPIAPPDRNDRVGNPVRFSWRSVPGAEQYRFLLSREYFFSSPDVDASLRDTTFLIDSLEYERTYYWRVRAANVSGSGGWSRVFTFVTIPPAPEQAILLAPPDRSTLPPSGITCAWLQSAVANGYRLQISEDSLFLACRIDDSTLSGTFFSLPPLPPDKTWFWRVQGINMGGAGGWSQVWRFRTSRVDAVGRERLIAAGYFMEQNHPNPFRASTNIRFVVPQDEFVSVKILSPLGKEIASIAGGQFPAGTHDIAWNAGQLPAGMYLLRIIAGSRVMVRRVIHLQ